MHRRPAAVLLAALVAVVAVLVMQLTQDVRAATSGSAGLALSATCVPVDDNTDTPDYRDITVRGHGFDPGTTVDLYVNVVGSESFPDPSDSSQVDDLGVFVGKVSLLLPGQSLSYSLSAVTRGASGPQVDSGRNPDAARATGQLHLGFRRPGSTGVDAALGSGCIEARATDTEP